jgi:hypothetical protein
VVTPLEPVSYRCASAPRYVRPAIRRYGERSGSIRHSECAIPHRFTGDRRRRRPSAEGQRQPQPKDVEWDGSCGATRSTRALLGDGRRRATGAGDAEEPSRASCEEGILEGCPPLDDAARTPRRTSGCGTRRISGRPPRSLAVHGNPTRENDMLTRPTLRQTLLAVTGAVLIAPGSAFAFNPQPDPPGLGQISTAQTSLHNAPTYMPQHAAATRRTGP